MKNLLYILKHDRYAITGLLVVVVAIAVIVVECSTSVAISPDDVDSLSVNESRGGKQDEGRYYAVESKPVHLQPFDPNTADSTTLLALGLQAWQVRSIYKYRAAGGAYTCPEDFSRLYGLTAKKYRELLPYIRIGADYRPASETVSHRHYDHSYSSGSSEGTETAKQHYAQTGETKLRPGETLALNSSDTTTLQRVPGIGPYFARKIVSYREKLGGYVNSEQLLEIQDFPESALPYFRLASSSSIRKININKATSEQLRNHPYINYQMAREILNYRRLRGDIHDLNDLSLLPLFKKETISRLRPYIEY